MGEDTVKRILKGNFDTSRRSWQNVSLEAQDLVRRLLVLDEGQRLTCVQALRHTWLRDAARPVPLLALPDASCEGALALYVPMVLSLLLRMPRLHPAQRLALAACAMASAESDLEPLVPWREPLSTACR